MQSRQHQERCCLQVIKVMSAFWCFLMLSGWTPSWNQVLFFRYVYCSWNLAGTSWFQLFSIIGLLQFARLASSYSSFGKCPGQMCKMLVERLYIVSCGLWMAVKRKAAISKHHKTKWWALQHYLFFFALWEMAWTFFFSVKRFGQLDPSVKVAGSCARNWRSEGEDLVWITGLKSVSKKISWLSRNQSKLETLCVWRDLQGTWCAPELLLEFSDFPTSSSELIRPWSRSS